MQQVPEPIIDAIQSAHLPSMPQVLLRFLRMAENERVSTAELAEVAGLDPALSAHVLIAANAAALRRGQEMKTLEQCLASLGPGLVRSMASCLAIQSTLPEPAEEYHHDLTGFWSHSLQAAELAGAIARQLGRADFEEARLAGLIHDIGQLLLLGGMNGRYGALLAWSRDEEALIALEAAELGCDHAAVGAWLVDQWRLSSFMADAVLFHHRPPNEIAGADPLSQIVWAAHAASGWPVAPESAAPRSRQFEAAAIEAMLGLPADSLVSLRRQAFERMTNLAADLGIEMAANVPPLPRSSQVPFESTRPVDQRDAGERIQAAVRDMATMQPLQPDWSAIDNEDDALRAVRESARIFFGLGRLAFLLVTDDGSSLAGASVGGQPALLRQLGIPIKADSSLAAKAALGEGHQATFDQVQAPAASVVDVQVARALGAEGVLYLPMRSRDRLIGVMAFGLSQSQYAHCRSRLDRMAGFARLAATSIEIRRGILARERQAVAELTGRFEQQARRVVHEAGNPLSIITNYLKIVAERLPDASGVRQELDILQEEIDRVAQIVQQFGSRAASVEADHRVDLNSVVQGMAALYRESLFASRGMSLELDLEGGLPAVPGSRDEIKQILLNLWRNAAEAMLAGGRLLVATSGAIRQDGGDYVELRVTDTGPGLPPDVAARLFEPLDPNRRPGHAGVGLSIVATMVKALDGRIACQSRPGQGTTFAILLPISGRPHR